MQSNAARKYDLSSYEEVRTSSTRRQQPVERPNLTVRTTRRSKAKVSPLRLLLCAVLLVALVAVAICNQVMMVERNHELNLANAQLAQLQTQNQELQTKLDSAASTKTIEEQAALMGMGRVEGYQVNYVTITGEDRIEVLEVSEGGSIIQTALNVYTDLLEYMMVN